MRTTISIIAIITLSYFTIRYLGWYGFIPVNFLVGGLSGWRILPSAAWNALAITILFSMQIGCFLVFNKIVWMDQMAQVFSLNQPLLLGLLSILLGSILAGLSGATGASFRTLIRQ